MVLSDILGDEDHLGDMDFKVTGTADGICACQMDIKIDGIDYDLLTNALKQAREGRLHILGIMNDVMSEAREELKPHTPRIVQYRIPGDKIGAVIGPGGKVIQAIQAETETVINIEEADGQGIVSIMGKGKEPIDTALMYVKGIADGPEVGTNYTAKIVKLMPYGAFIEFLPGQEGLLHVSELAWERIDNVEDVLTAGETVEVRYMGLDDRTGKHKLSRKVLLPKPEGYVERPPRERRDDRGRGGRDGRPPRRDDRRGGRNDRRDRR